GGDLAGGVGHGLHLAALGTGRAGVVHVGGDIRDIRARTIGGEHVAVTAIRVRPSAGDIWRYGGVGDRRRERVALPILSARGRAIRFGDRQGYAETRVPYGGDLALAGTRSRRIGGQVTRARAPGGEPFHSDQFQTSGRVIGVTGEVAIVVGTTTDEAGRIVSG